MNKRILSLLALLLCVAVVLCACAGNGSDESTIPSDDHIENNTVESTGGNDSTTDTESTEDVPTDPTYVVSVVDQNGDPVEGVMLQFCDDTSCKMPEMTGADGKVSKSYPESNYHVTVTAPEGYTCDTAEFYFAEGETELTIELTKN